MPEIASKKPKIIFILGMHRSGTSMLANILHELGVSFGEEADLFSANHGNIFGHFEHKDAIEVNYQIFKEYKGDWINPPALQEGWLSDEPIMSFKDLAKKLLLTLSREPLSAIKVPNLMFTYDLWLNLCEEIDIEPVVLGIYRNPLEVAASLEKRNQMAKDESLRHWLKYNTKLLDLLTDNSTLLRYETIIDKPDLYISYIANLLKLEVSEEQLLRASLTINPTIKHSNITDTDIDSDKSIPQEVRDTLRELNKINTKNAINKEIIQEENHRLEISKAFFHSKIKLLDQLIRSQKEETEKKIKEMESMIKERDNTISKLEELFENKKEEVAKLDKSKLEALQSMEILIDQKDSTIKSMEALIKEKDEAVDSQTKMIDERDARIKQLEEQSNNKISKTLKNLIKK